jgi:hypothetical protein
MIAEMSVPHSAAAGPWELMFLDMGSKPFIEQQLDICIEDLGGDNCRFRSHAAVIQSRLEDHVYVGIVDDVVVIVVLRPGEELEAIVKHCSAVDERSVFRMESV